MRHSLTSVDILKVITNYLRGNASNHYHDYSYIYDRYMYTKKWNAMLAPLDCKIYGNVASM